MLHITELYQELATAFAECFFTVDKREDSQKTISGKTGKLPLLPKELQKRYSRVIHDSEYEHRTNLFTILSIILPALVSVNILVVTATALLSFSLNIAYLPFHTGHNLNDE